MSFNTEDLDIERDLNRRMKSLKKLPTLVDQAEASDFDPSSDDHLPGTSSNDRWGMSAGLKKREESREVEDMDTSLNMSEIIAQLNSSHSTKTDSTISAPCPDSKSIMEPKKEPEEEDGEFLNPLGLVMAIPKEDPVSFTPAETSPVLLDARELEEALAVACVTEEMDSEEGQLLEKPPSSRPGRPALTTHSVIQKAIWEKLKRIRQEDANRFLRKIGPEPQRYIAEANCVVDKLKGAFKDSKVSCQLCHRTISPGSIPGHIYRHMQPQAFSCTQPGCEFHGSQPQIHAKQSHPNEVVLFRDHRSEFEDELIDMLHQCFQVGEPSPQFKKLPTMEGENSKELLQEVDETTKDLVIGISPTNLSLLNAEHWKAEVMPELYMDSLEALRNKFMVSGFRELKCQQNSCPFTISKFNFTLLEVHILMHLRKGVYMCNICDMKLPEVDVHFAIAHPGAQLQYRDLRYGLDEELGKMVKTCFSCVDFSLTLKERDLIVALAPTSASLVKCYPKSGTAPIKYLEALHNVRQQVKNTGVLRCLKQPCNYSDMSNFQYKKVELHLLKHTKKPLYICGDCGMKLMDVEKHFKERHPQTRLCYRDLRHLFDDQLADLINAMFLQNFSRKRPFSASVSSTEGPALELEAMVAPLLRQLQEEAQEPPAKWPSLDTPMCTPVVETSCALVIKEEPPEVEILQEVRPVEPNWAHRTSPAIQNPIPETPAQVPPLSPRKDQLEDEDASPDRFHSAQKIFKEDIVPDGSIFKKKY